MIAKTNVEAATERAVRLFMANGGILNTKKAIKLGIHSRTLYALRDDGRLERMERGLYRLASAAPLGNSDFVTVALKVPRGVICLISALAFHHMTTQIPHAVYLAIGANDQAPALRYPPLRLFWYSKEVHESGISETKMDGATVRIYSPEKTLVDCFKFRNKIGTDVAIEALRECRRLKKASMDELWAAAKACRVANIMRPYMESL